MKAQHAEVHESQANIFADLCRPDAESHMLKAQIVAELYRLATERELNQTESGSLMGLTQPEVSRLFRGTFREFSIERLMSFLTAFDRDVEIVSRPRAPDKPRHPVTFRPTTA